ncbi:dihydropteroate synthase [Bacteroidota bacterium]
MTAKDTFFQKKYTLNIKGDIVDLSIPKVMGILNVTPDSFYDGGRYNSTDRLKNRIDQMINDGADFIDIGAYSSRPGSAEISETEEWKRIHPVLNILCKDYSEQVVSIDTFRSEIAKRAITDFRVSMINDISAGEMDINMFKVIAGLNVPYIIMHMSGHPQNMQENPSYKNVTKEVNSYLAAKVEKLKKIGVNDVIIDPGFGFGKTLEHNYELLNNLEAFNFFQLPLLVGLSRKSMIYKLLENTPDESLTGTIALNTIALMKGASIIRVHDVKEAKETITLYNKTIQYKNSV